MRLEAEVINWAIRIKIYDKSDQSEELCADFAVTLSSKDTSVIQNWFCISAVQSFADVCLHVVTVYQASEAIWKICEANCKMLTGGHLTFWTLKNIKHVHCTHHVCFISILWYVLSFCCCCSSILFSNFTFLSNDRSGNHYWTQACRRSLLSCWRTTSEHISINCALVVISIILRYRAVKVAKL